MRFWISRDTRISIREQLSAQLLLAILSRKLAPGARLPSVRELARRLKIHSNTVSAVYQDLASRGWVAQRRGSGVFVSSRGLPRVDEGAPVFAKSCFDEGLRRGYEIEELRVAFTSAIEQRFATAYFVFDPDREFARILASEIGEALGRAVPFGASIGDAKPGACILLNPAHTPKNTIAGNGFRAIELRSMPEVVSGHSRPGSAVLIAVVSRSESILQWSKTLLSALGFPPECVVLRNPRDNGWSEGLRSCGIVAVDVISRTEMPSGIAPEVFRVVSDDFLDALRKGL